jgi:hypothetical protein
VQYEFGGGGGNNWLGAGAKALVFLNAGLSGGCTGGRVGSEEYEDE